MNLNPNLAAILIALCFGIVIFPWAKATSKMDNRFKRNKLFPTSSRNKSASFCGNYRGLSGSHNNLIGNK